MFSEVDASFSLATYLINSRLRITDLKIILRKMGQPVTGKKPDLIQRTVDTLSLARDQAKVNQMNNNFAIYLNYIAQENGGTLDTGYG